MTPDEVLSSVIYRVSIYRVSRLWRSWRGPSRAAFGGGASRAGGASWGRPACPARAMARTLLARSPALAVHVGLPRHFRQERGFTADPARREPRPRPPEP